MHSTRKYEYTYEDCDKNQTHVHTNMLADIQGSAIAIFLTRWKMESEGFLKSSSTRPTKNGDFSFLLRKQTNDSDSVYFDL